MNVDVLVVGAGVAGAAAAFHLASAAVARDADAAVDGIQRPLLLRIVEAGVVGLGSTRAVATHPVPTARAALGDEPTYAVGMSGSAVYAGGAHGPRRIKMVDTVLPCRAAEFIAHHGMVGASLYRVMATEGMRVQQTLVKQHFGAPDAARVVQTQGTMILVNGDAPEECGSEDELRGEMKLLQAAGYTCEWMGREAVQREMRGTRFTAAIWLPHGAIIDSTAYAQALVRAAVAKSDGKRLECTVHEHTRVVRVEDEEGGDGAWAHLSDGRRIWARRVVVATGAFWSTADLAGLLRPCYSYIAAVRARPGTREAAQEARDVSPNYLTLGYSHDWAWCEGWLRVSGEDGYSALRAPRMAARCQSLAEWAKKQHAAQLPREAQEVEMAPLHGVYSETPDYLPLAGPPRDGSALVYVVGCNAWAQGPLAYIATLVPGWVGWSRDAWTPQQQAVAELVSLQRFRIRHDEAVAARL